LAPKVTKSYKEAIKKRILIAAFKEFSLKGYHKTNLDDVARAIGIARGTIYLYFPSKQRLFEALSELQLRRLRDLLRDRDWSSSHASSAARSFFRESRRGSLENSEWMAIEMLAESARNKELRRQRLLETRRMQQIITEFIQIQLKNKKIKAGKEFTDLALGTIALYNGLNMFKVLGYSDQEIEDAWARTISFLVDGIANRDSKIADLQEIVR
jgi:AcrR family transcriptional regulator